MIDEMTQTPPSAGLFAWLRSLGLERRNGWIGGVCAAVAARLGVDALVVRGVFLVAAVLGFPMLVVYAVGWALLPDERGAIALRLRPVSPPAIAGILLTLALQIVVSVAGSTAFQAVRQVAYEGRFVWAAMRISLVIAAIALPVVVLLLLVRRSPTARGARYYGTRGVVLVVLTVLGCGFVSKVVLFVVLGWDDNHFSWDATAMTVVFLFVVTILLGLTVLVVRLVARRVSSPVSVGGLGGASGATADRPAAAQESAAGPISAATPAPESDFEAWREQHEALRDEHESWRADQVNAERNAREEDRVRRRTEADAFRAEVQRLRAERRALRPRISLAYGAVTLGLALVVGAVAALLLSHRDGWASSNDRVSAAIAGALLVAALVTSVGMVVAGILRRRSGVLALFATVCLVAGGGALVSGWVVLYLDQFDDRTYTVNASADPQVFSHRGGSTEVWIGTMAAGAGEVDLNRETGETTIEVDPRMSINLHVARTEASVSAVENAGNGGSTPQVLDSDSAIEWTYAGTDDSIDPIDVYVSQPEGTIQVMISGEEWG
ncbi:MAG: PspC domain-containing protein [Microbacterium sp.]